MAKTKRGNATVLRRYTNLPALLHLLQSKQITLLNPRSWADKNDVLFMSQFKKRKGLTSVLAVCFSEARETYHHWKVFTNGSEGVCIEFDGDRLLAAFSKWSNIRKGRVRYKAIVDLEDSPPSPNQLPFLKRLPYRDEKEFRLVYFAMDDEEETDAKEFDIKLGYIRRITLNPWLSRPLVEAVKSTIHSIDGCHHLGAFQSTILENDRWKDVAL